MKVRAHYNGLEIDIPNTSGKSLIRLQKEGCEFPYPLYCIIKNTSQKVYLTLESINFSTDE